jgi:hypothetical protein
MFDVLDVLVPGLSTDARFEVRQEQTAFGPSDDRFAHVDGMRFAQIVMARDVYTNVEAGTGSSGRDGWTVLLAAGVANAAAGDDETWGKFLAALVVVLSAHTFWRVTCESDCDQHPLEKLKLSPQHLSRLLDSYRSKGQRLIAIQASAP